MATGKLIGADDATANGSLGANFTVCDKFPCVANGSCSEIKIKVSTNLNAKVAIYDDVAGVPTNRLAKQDTGQACTSGWNTIPLEAAVNLVKDTPYWIVYIADTNQTGGVNTAGSGHKYQTSLYSGYTFPATLPAQLTYDAFYSLFAGWGVLVISPSSISQPIAYGTPEVIISSAKILQPSSIVQVVAIGTPALLYPQILLPSSIIQAIVYGTPSVGTYGIIRPSSIIQQISIGSPTLLKYVWHVILDGQYNIESPEVNRAYVIGQDAYGNPVYGTAVDATEGALVGERLDFQQDLAIPLTAQAAEVAAAILSKIRITGKKGLILIPPNCGQELFDIVQISDAGANQAAVSFRVVGIRFEYNPKQARYEHRLLLGAP